MLWDEDCRSCYQKWVVCTPRQLQYWPSKLAFLDSVAIVQGGVTPKTLTSSFQHFDCWPHWFSGFDRWLHWISTIDHWLRKHLWKNAQRLHPSLVQTDSMTSFTIKTGGQKCHVMWILVNQQAAWWCNALQLPSERCYVIHLYGLTRVAAAVTIASMGVTPPYCLYKGICTLTLTYCSCQYCTLVGT